MEVTVILTVLNESGSIRSLLASLAAQSRPPDQVVICDGGSTDGTVAAVRLAVAEYGDRLGDVDLFVLPGANISRGRNAAIARARSPLIAATDAGVRLDRCWLEHITVPWQKGDGAGPAIGQLAAGGFFVPDADSVFETAMAATVLPSIEDINPDRFLPSSRSVAFLKSTWEAAGGYPEWLDYCEDLVFDFRVNGLTPDRESAFVWCPDAVVHFRPRSSLGAFWKQYYRYARGDGKADLWRKRHAIRYATYLVLLPTLLFLVATGGSARLLGLAALLGGVMAYCRRPWLRLRAAQAKLMKAQFIAAAAWVPPIRLVGDLAKMSGYPVGLYWRWKNRRRRDIYWRSNGGS